LKTAGHRERVTDARERFTEARLEALGARATQYVTWDVEPTGFGVRVSPGGAKTFVFVYRNRFGRVRWKTLGRVGDLSLEAARRRARVDAGLVNDDKDPLAVRDAARGAVTFGQVADRFLEDHVDARRRASTARHYRQAIETHLRPRFGARAIAEIAARDVLKFHHALKATPMQANRVVAILSSLCSWAVRAGYLESNPCVGAIEKYRERPRRRYLTPAEFKRLGAALRVGERRGRVTPAAAAAIRLLLFTGMRRGEVLSLRRDAVDLQQRVLRLADSKTGPRVIVLNAAAVDVLKTWPTFASPYVFPSETRRDDAPDTPHRVDLNKPWAWLRRRARLADVRLHDLRHAFASVAVSGKQTLPIVGALLGHTQPATTARYAHLLDDPVRAASEATGATIAAAVGRRKK